MSKKFHVAIAGATGAVGRVMMSILEERNFPIERLTLLASARSAGQELPFKGETVKVKELTEDSFEGVDIALFSAGAGVSRRFAPCAVKSGAVVIDNSSAFRMESDVPLVVPEVNSHAIRPGIIANPNCSTIQMVVALKPIHDKFRIKRIVVSTYQAVSGSGQKAIEELERQCRDILSGKPAENKVYPHQIAFNCLPHIDVFMENGYTKEEMKMENEGRKILNHPRFRASTTCVRIPVYRSHSIAVNAEFTKPVNLATARRAIRRAPGIQLQDDVDNNVYPLALDMAEQYDCAVGRLRKDCALKNGLSFWVVGDQLLKGAALNAVQIAEVLAGKK